MLLIFASGYYLGKRFDFTHDQNNELVTITYSQNEQKIKRLMSLIDNQYIDDVNTDSLIDNAIENIVSKLDPHSAYLTEKEANQLEEEMKGEFVGVGIQYRVHNDTLVVTRVLKESPNLGKLKASDRILSANRVDLIGHNSLKAGDVLRGKAGTKIKTEILRNNQTKTIEIIRNPIPVKSVVASHLINDKIGYIKLIRFGEKSAQEVSKSIKDLKKKGMQTLIFDLRSNPGGIMSAAEKISDEFLKDKELIVYTQDKNGDKEYRYATKKGNFEDNKVYILIDEGSASASEIVAGAVQEYDKGIIVGRRSFGKGLVQKEVGLGDGTRLRLTTAHYYTPSGRSIQKPYKNKDYDEDYINRFRNGEFTHEDSVYINQNLKFTTPSGKTVYGGGGIIPDVFVPLDTVQLTTWFYASGGNNRISDFVFEYIDKNKDKTTLQNEKIYFDSYDDLNVLNEFLNWINVKKTQINQKDQSQLNLYLKAFIARQLFGENSFYKVWNLTDNTILKVLELETKEPNREI